MTATIHRGNGGLGVIVDERLFARLLDEASGGSFEAYDTLRTTLGNLIAQISTHTSTLIPRKLLEKADALAGEGRLDLAAGVLEAVREILVDDQLRFALGILRTQGL